MRALHDAQDVSILAATIMPDHVHMLFTLGSHLRVGQLLAKFKTLARQQGFMPWRWQDESLEELLSEAESTESYAFYTYMNPYRANLLALHDRWPWWFSPRSELFQFSSAISEDEPIPMEWCGRAERVAKTLIV